MLKECITKWVRRVLRGTGTTSGHPKEVAGIAYGWNTTGSNEFGREYRGMG